MYLRRLKNTAQVVLLLAALSIVGGIITGLVLITTTEETGSFGGDEHLYVAEGVSVAVGGIVLGALLTFLAYWALAWADANEPRHQLVPAPPVLR